MAPFLCAQAASNNPKDMPNTPRRPLSPTMLASSCVRGTRSVRSVEEYVEDSAKTIFRVIGEAVGRIVRLLLSAGGVRGAPAVSLLSARNHPRALLAAVTLSCSTLSTGLSCHVRLVRSAPGLGVTVRAVGAEMLEKVSGPGKEGLDPSASSSMDWQE